jgi:phage terminase large subunit-like protein
MAAKNPKTRLTMSEVAQTLAEQTRLQAIQPNIFGYVPHDKQVIFHSHASQHRLYIGGNRSGKTTSGIVEDIWWLSGTHPYRKTPEAPVRGRIVGVDFTNGIELNLKPLFIRWCPPSYLRGGSWSSAWDAQTRTINFANGSTCEFMSYEQDLDSFAGTSRHFVHFDEEPPQEIYIECLARLIDTAGSYWMTLTPIMGMEWMYDEIYMKGINSHGSLENPSTIGVIEVDMHENPYLPETEIETFINALDADDRDARVKGKFIRRGGLVYKTFDPQIHVIPALDQIPKLWEIYMSLDHGYNNPTAVLWHGVDPDGSVITFFEHYKAEWTVEEHCVRIHEINKQLGRVPDVNVCDPALAQRSAVTGDSIQAEYAKHGVYLALGNNDVMTGINKINTYLKSKGAHGKPNWLITENCENLIREMQKLRWKTWASKQTERTNNKYDVIHKKDDHAPDSARYFFTMMPDLTPVPAHKSQTVQNILDAAVGVNPAQGIYDSNFQREREGRQQPEWDIQAMDEYMGAEW